MFGDFYNFVVIQNFSALITFIVGLSAFLVYFWQQRDEKKNAARLIISEIREAEARVQEVVDLNESKNKDFPIVLSSNNWREKSYLFASDLDQDELGEINRFYSICESIDEYAKRDNEFFWISSQHRASLAQDILSKSIVDSFNPSTGQVDDSKVNSFIEKILRKYTDHGYQYSPQKTVNEIKRYTSQFNRISTTTTLMKLKKIARLNENPWYQRLIPHFG